MLTYADSLRLAEEAQVNLLTYADVRMLTYADVC